ncbi:MAG TPA: PspC domain-containing protein [Acidimicrobiia bacterium]|nr:PspC domain-containing protein [Acidimicrobiia bacterium]
METPIDSSASPPPEVDPASLPDESPRVSTAPGPLVRPQEGRWLAGVAIGVAHRLGIPPWVARLLFFLAFASGGVGLFLYLAGWLLIPAEGEPDSLGQRLARRVEGTQAWFGIGLVILAGAIILNMLPFVDAGLLVPTILLVLGILLYRNELPRLFASTSQKTEAGESGEGAPPAGPPARVTTPPRPVRPPQPPSPLGRITLGLALLGNGALLVADRASPLVEANWRHYLAVTLVALGLGLLVGSRYGRARWLIPLGIISFPFLVGATVWEYTEVGRDEYLTVESFSQFPLVLERGTGRLTIDLTQLDWDGQAVGVDASMSAGQIDFLVPETVGVDFTGEVGIGSFGGSFGGGMGGFGVEQDFETEGTRGLVAIDAEVGVGAISVLLQYDEQQLLFPEAGDLFLDIDDESLLDERYFTPDGSIALDLSRLHLSEDRYLRLEAPLGPVTVVVPDGISYRVRAYSDVGAINLFGEQLGEGGTVRADSIQSGAGPVLELEIITSEGDITVITEGERS